MRRIIHNEQEWEFFAALLAKAITSGFKLYLSGELGAGKTTLVRALLRQLGITGVVKSPTYTLVETYIIENHVGACLAQVILHHFDLYRLQSAQELQYLGLEEYFTENAVVIVEWPEKGLEVLPDADLFCTLSYYKSGRCIDCVAHGTHGEWVLEQLR